LAAIFNNVIRLGKIVEKDPLLVYIDRAPSMSDKSSWLECLSEGGEAADGEDDLTHTQTSSTAGSSFRQDALFVHPKSLAGRRRQQPRRGEPTATGCQDNTDSARPRVVPRHRDLPAGGRGREASEWYRISSPLREAARQINDRVAGRRSSMSVTNSGILSRTSILVLIHINNDVCYIFAAVRIEMDGMLVLFGTPPSTIESGCFNSYRLIT
jgi:hypothetical protein